MKIWYSFCGSGFAKLDGKMDYLIGVHSDLSGQNSVIHEFS